MSDLDVDVVVVGYGGAGVCAALEASAEGARVLVLERFEGGGATRASGGVVYAGGGTPHQRAAGFDDQPEHMLAYLQHETRAESDTSLLETFCARSLEDLRWLESHGLHFPATFCAEKCVVPPEGVGLYYSGNEQAAAGPQAPRGHVPDGHGQRGRVLFDALAASARASGVLVRRRCKATGLLTNAHGRVIGVEALQLPTAGPALLAHEGLYKLALAARPVGDLLDVLERKAGQPLRVTARGGVVIAAGGFVFNGEMLKQHAPEFLGAMPLGTPGDDGSGIAMGTAVGAALGHMHRCAVWRFLYPPAAFLRGVLVNSHGARFCDESLYGATVGRALAEQPGGRAFLIVDQAVVRAVREESAADERILERPWREILAGEANDLLFRKFSTSANLHLNRRRARSLTSLEQACALPAGSLVHTLGDYNARIRAGQADPCGKPEKYRRVLEEPPFLAIVCDLDSKLFLGPCFTLGGLRTDSRTAQVMRRDGTPIAGLYAAGRSAVGVCTGGYVSGLSVADCVFSGRNAGRSAARAALAERAGIR